MTMDEKKKMLAIGLFKNFSTRVEPEQIYVDPLTGLASHSSSCSNHIYFYIPFEGWFSHVTDIRHKGSLTKKIPSEYSLDFVTTMFSENFKKYFSKEDINIVDIGSKHFLLAYSMKDQTLYIALISYSYAKKKIEYYEFLDF